MYLYDLKIYINNKELISTVYDFEINKEIYNYDSLNLKIYINKNEEIYYKSLFNEEVLKIKIDIRDKNIFSGNIIKLECITNKKEIEINILARSYLYELTKKEKLLFSQDYNINYKNIVDKIMKEYKIEYIVEKEMDSKANEILLQYLETDFDFLKRILQNRKIKLFENNGVIIFGNKVGNEIKCDYIKKSEIKENEIYVKYIVDDVININDVYQGINVTKVRIFSIYEKIYFEIECKENLEFTKKYNHKIIGLHIEAEVLEIHSEQEIAKMTVTVKNTFDKISGRYFEDSKLKLPYKTFYSKTNTGLFCTPEKGDIVEIYFPNYDANFARISWSINNIGSSRFNEKNRNYNINDNCYMKIIDNNFILKNNDILINNNNFSIKSNNILNYSKEIISNHSETGIIFESKQNTEILGKSIKIESSKNDIDIISRKNINIKGTNIYNG